GTPGTRSSLSASGSRGVRQAPRDEAGEPADAERQLRPLIKLLPGEDRLLLGVVALELREEPAADFGCRGRACAGAQLSLDQIQGGPDLAALAQHHDDRRQQAGVAEGRKQELLLEEDVTAQGPD